MSSSESTIRSDSHAPENGLIVRPSTLQDAEDLLLLVDTVFGGMIEAGYDTHMTHLVRRVMHGAHPSMGPGDFTLVEDTQRKERRIVGCTCLLNHTWEYEGIPFAVGRPEIIATYPEYRQQGLIRKIFAMVHARSAARGHLVQAITGIPYFYRQFNYEYALDVWDTFVIDDTCISHLPIPARGLYTLRDATKEDIALIQQLYDHQRRKGMVSQIVNEQWWQYQIQTWSNQLEQNINSHVQMIIDDTQNAKGYLITPVPQSKSVMRIWDMEVTEDVNLVEAMPAILRALFAQGFQERTTLQQNVSLKEIHFMLLRAHPVFRVLNTLYQRVEKPAFAWYVRVENLPQFLYSIAPVLESRLTNANIENFAGELKIDFYRSGLRLVFDQGHLLVAEEWQRPIHYVKADAGFPPNIFLQLLFGRRTLEELCYAFPDVWVQDQAALLLQTLFPAKPSWILPLW